MESKLPLFNWSLKKLLSAEPDNFNKSRIKILYTILIVVLIKIIILVPIAFYHDQNFQVARGLVLFVFYAGILKVLLNNKSSIKTISHVAILGGIILVWTNIFISAFTVNLITTQMVFMIIMTSFYLLNNRYGVIYSLISSLPIVIYLILFGREQLKFSLPTGELASPAYEIIVVLNFITIALAHYLFQQASNININEKVALNQELREAVDRANQSAQSKSDFLSTMSHELRTPLNSVIGITELLLDDPHNEDQKENLKILSFSAVSLHALVNDVLDFNKIDSGKLYLESLHVNLSELIDNVCSGLRLQAKEKGLNLVLDIDESIASLYVMTDPTRITQIIYNLVGNGIKFTNQGGVTISLKALEKSSEEISIRFSIADTGIGIDTDKHETIFESFTQASRSTTRSFGGTGLGLTIVKKLLGLFGSTINLESSLNKGSNFFFDISFKLGNQAIEIPAVGTESRSDLTGLKVLVAEDNQMNVLLLKKIFSKWNIEPVFAENGLDAVQKVSSASFDVVLMDIHMPVMDGYQATNEIRNLPDPAKSALPIIALTASISDMELRIKEVGMDDFIYKPFNSKELYNKLRRVRKELNKSAALNRNI